MPGFTEGTGKYITPGGITKHWEYYDSCLWPNCKANPGTPCIRGNSSQDILRGEPGEPRGRAHPNRRKVKLPGDEKVVYDGVKMKIRDIPHRPTRQMFGVGHPNPNGRKAIKGRYCYKPSECEFTAAGKFTKWIANGTILICTGCGLDCT